MVIALLGLLLSVGLPKMDRVTRANIRTGVRRLGALVKVCYDQAILTGKIHRIAFDLSDDKAAEKKPQSWKLEMAMGDALPEEQLKEEITGSSSSSSSSSEDPAAKATAVQPYVPANDSAKHYLPLGIKILKIKSWRLGQDVELKKGPIAAYCFPNGFVDDLTVYLQESGKPKSNVFVVKTRSLTGRVDISTEEPSATP